MIYLNAEVISGLGEDTFWTWFKREFPTSSFKVPDVISDTDVILRYSTLGYLNTPGKQVALLWELLPEMKEVLKSNIWDEKIHTTYECAKWSTYRVVASHLMIKYYERFGSVDVLPIGVNTDLFRPMNKKELRERYEIPSGKKVGFWAGTTHPMKGFHNLLKWSKNNDIHWVIVWKQQDQAGHMPGQSNFVNMNQNQLAELMNCADFMLSCGTLQPFYMVEWEAMACDLPIVNALNLHKDFIPSKHPRKDIFNLKWDRNSAKKEWLNYLTKKGILC